MDFELFDLLIFGFLLLCSVISVAKLFVIIMPIVFSPLSLPLCLFLSLSVYVRSAAAAAVVLIATGPSSMTD